MRGTQLISHDTNSGKRSAEHVLNLRIDQTSSATLIIILVTLDSAMACHSVEW